MFTFSCNLNLKLFHTNVMRISEASEEMWYEDNSLETYHFYTMSTVKRLSRPIWWIDSKYHCENIQIYLNFKTDLSGISNTGLRYLQKLSFSLFFYLQVLYDQIVADTSVVILYFVVNNVFSLHQLTCKQKHGTWLVYITKKSEVPILLITCLLVYQIWLTIGNNFAMHCKC